MKIPPIFIAVFVAFALVALLMGYVLVKNSDSNHRIARELAASGYISEEDALGLRLLNQSIESRRYGHVSEEEKCTVGELNHYLDILLNPKLVNAPLDSKHYDIIYNDTTDPYWMGWNPEKRKIFLQRVNPLFNGTARERWTAITLANRWDFNGADTQKRVMQLRHDPDLQVRRAAYDYLNVVKKQNYFY